MSKKENRIIAKENRKKERVKKKALRKTGKILIAVLIVAIIGIVLFFTIRDIANAPEKEEPTESQSEEAKDVYPDESQFSKYLHCTFDEDGVGSFSQLVTAEFEGEEGRVTLTEVVYDPTSFAYRIYGFLNDEKEVSLMSGVYEDLILRVTNVKVE